VAYRAKDKAFFIYGFAKSERENLAPDELATARRIGTDLLAADASRVGQAIFEGEIQEIGDDE
jgi:hypothetical protein